MIRITITYDNTATREDLTADWGFSCLIEAHGHRILFDTGETAEILSANMAALGIPLDGFDEVFISHCHHDHIGGLSIVDNNRVPVYVPDTCAELVRFPTAHKVSEPCELHKNIFSTGELGFIEQSLVIKQGRDAIVVVGCSHPGVAEILTAAREIAEPKVLIGGLHGFDQYELLAPLDKVCPTHCTQHQTEIASHCPDKLLTGGVGAVLR